jgi:hypothetical protein
MDKAPCSRKKKVWAPSFKLCSNSLKLCSNSCRHAGWRKRAHNRPKTSQACPITVQYCTERKPSRSQKIPNKRPRWGGVIRECLQMCISKVEMASRWLMTAVSEKGSKKHIATTKRSIGKTMLLTQHRPSMTAT